MGPGKQNELIHKCQVEEAINWSIMERSALILIPRCEHYMGLPHLYQLPFIEEANMEDYLAKHLIQIIQEYGIHEHNAMCKKNGHADNDNNYRISYLQKLFDDIAIYLDLDTDKDSRHLIINGINIIFPYDHQFVVLMNKWITLTMTSNMAVYYIPLGIEGRIRAIYT